MKNEINLLTRVSIATRIWIILGMAFAAIGFGTVIYLYEFKNQMLDSRKEELKFLTETVFSAVDRLHGLAVSGALSEAEAKNAALATVKALRYDKDS